MKRTLFLLLTIILCSVVPIGQTYATTPDYSENYWSLEEIMAVREDAKQEIIAVCQDSPEFDCTERYHAEILMPRGSDYQAADNMNAFRYLITAVNLAENTVRVLYYDEDMVNYYMTGELIEENLNELYMFWFDLGHLGYDFYNQYHAGALPDKTHLLFARENLATSFPPKEEVTFKLEGDVKDNYRNMIYYYFVTEGGVRYMDPIDYNSCINHPAYKEGMECRLFYEKSEGGNPIYLPVEVATATDNTGTDDTTDSTNDTTDGAADTILDDTASPEIPNPEEQDTTVIPLAPNTGTDATCKQRQIELPWWMIGLIAAGEIITIYCLAPNLRKFRKKS